MVKITSDLSNEFHPVPKPAKKEKKKPQPIGPGKKVLQWADDRSNLKKQFAVWGIVTCEIGVELNKQYQIYICVKDNFLGFAHTQRRVKLSAQEIRDPKKVVLACQPCHNYVDLEMPREEAENFLAAIVEKRALL